MKEESYEQIRLFVEGRTRLSFHGHKKVIFRKKLEARMEELALDSKEYLRLLTGSPREEKALIDVITVNETFFFRNQKQFAYLADRIIPELEVARGKAVMQSWGESAPGSPRALMQVRVLSAGCSTGEEPYSIAMAFREALQYPKAWDIRIQAGDISERALGIASRGEYEEERLKSLPAHLRKKYLHPTVAGGTIVQEVRDMVEFAHLNLGSVIDGLPLFGNMPGIPVYDLIFCRNVLIYFSAESQQRVVDLLSRSLVPGGYLFTGDVEPLHLYEHSLQTVDDAGCLLYRKPLAQ